jgi:hypothetical protein
VWPKGIPAASIVDVDVLKEGGVPWTNILDGANVPPINRTALATLRANIKTAIDATGRNMKREGGIAILQAGGPRGGRDHNLLACRHECPPDSCSVGVAVEASVELGRAAIEALRSCLPPGQSASAGAAEHRAGAFQGLGAVNV